MPYTRNSMIAVMRSFIGAQTGDPKHKYIIDTYNGFVSAGRSKGSKYKMKYTDPWCATTISSCAILAGCTDIIPTECSCTRMIALFKDMKCFEPNDNYANAKPGDFIFYKWYYKKNGKQYDIPNEEYDCDGEAHHVGIIESCDGKYYTVIEGNYSNKCQRRKVKVGWKYIHGFGLPKYTDNAVYHLVKSGDNLSKIAKKYSTTVDNILTLNTWIKNPNIIRVGWEIRVQ